MPRRHPRRRPLNVRVRPARGSRAPIRGVDLRPYLERLEKLNERLLIEKRNAIEEAGSDKAKKRAATGQLAFVSLYVLMSESGCDASILSVLRERGFQQHHVSAQWLEPDHACRPQR